MNNKSIISIMVVVLMALSCVIMVVPDDADATSYENKVTITIEWNADYRTNGHDATNRIAAANTQIDSDGYDTLASAVESLAKLYSSATNGVYSGSYQNSQGGTSTYTNANPLYYYASERPSSYDHNPIDSVQFTVYGTVASGSNDTITIRADDNYYRIPTISIVGMGTDAKISGQTKITARTAGGYESVFTGSGSFTVFNIEFTATSGNTVIEVDGSTYSGNGHAQTTLTVNGCTFHNQLHSCVNDRTSTITKVISNNQFTNDGSIGYAYFLQGQANTLRFENNIVNGYIRGINIQEEGSDVNATITGNTFMNNSIADRGCIQICQANDVVISGNTMTNIVGNAIWLWNDSVDAHCNSLTVTNNDVQAEYLINNDQGDVRITITDNNLDITYPGYCMEKNATSPSVSDVYVDYSGTGGSSTTEDDEDYPFFPWNGNNQGTSTTPSSDDSSDGNVKTIAAAAAIVVILIGAVALMVNRNN